MPKAQEFGMHKATEAHSCIVFRCKLLGVNAEFDLTTFSNVRAVSRRTFQAAPEEPETLLVFANLTHFLIGEKVVEKPYL